MKATIKDVAHSAGVSTATVSHVFNNTRYVSSEIVDRVRLQMNWDIFLIILQRA